MCPDDSTINVWLDNHVWTWRKVLIIVHPCCTWTWFYNTEISFTLNSEGDRISFTTNLVSNLVTHWPIRIRYKSHKIWPTNNTSVWLNGFGPKTFVKYTYAIGNRNLVNPVANFFDINNPLLESSMDGKKNYKLIMIPTCDTPICNRGSSTL